MRSMHRQLPDDARRQFGNFRYRCKVAVLSASNEAGLAV